MRNVPQEAARELEAPVVSSEVAAELREAADGA
jgi:hypothetical protein